ncbi:hypothetical protein Tco_0532863 [Tanacetum coccineum]
MTTGQRKPEAQWIADERKAANLDQRLKSLIMSVLPNDQINSVINCLTAKSTWDDLILYHEGPSDVKESRVIDLKLCYNTFKFIEDKEEVSSDDEAEVKVLMALIDEERIYVGKKSTKNDEWTKITIKKVHTLLEMEDNDDRKSFLDYLYNSDMSNTSSNVHKSSKAEDYTLPNHDADEHSFSSTEKLDGAKPGSGPNTIKSILKSKSTFKAKTLKGITLNEPSSAPARGNKSSLASKTNLAHPGKLKNVKVEDDPLLAMHHTGQSKSSSRSRPSRSSVSFPYCIHCGYNNHHSDDCLYYPTCEICGSYDHNTHDHNMIISQRRGINPRNPQHGTKNYETCGNNVHTTSDHNEIEWFKKRETPHSKKAESSNALRLKTPTKRSDTQVSLISVNEIKQILRNPTLLLLRELSELSTKMDIKGGIYGEVGLNTFRNTIGAHHLPHSSEYVVPPSIDVVRKWFPTIEYGEECLGGKIGGFDQITNKDVIMLYSLANGIHIDYANIFWEDIILKLMKKQREKVVPYTRFLSLLIMRKMKEDYGTDEPRAKTRYKKPITSLKQPSVSSKEATKGRSSKAPTGSKIGHSKKRKESSSAMDSNPSRPSISTPVDTEMHKEDQQATGGPTSLGITSKERANPQLSSGMLILNLNKPIFSTSFIIHSESASGHDVLADSTAEADPRLSAPNDSIPPQQGMDEGTKNTSYDHIFAEKGASFTAIHGDKEEASTAIHDDKEEASGIIKLEDLAKLVSQIHPGFKDLDSPKDDSVIIIDESDKDEPNAKIGDTLVPRSSSPRSSQIQELTNQVLILQFQKHRLELKKNKAEAEATLLKAQPLFLNVEQLNELLLKEIPTKLEDFTKTATSLTSHDAELKTLQLELPKKFLSLPAKVKPAQSKLKTLDALPSLLLNVTKALNKFAEVLESNSTKAGDKSIPLAGQADTMLVEREKDTNQATIS